MRQEREEYFEAIKKARIEKTRTGRKGKGRERWNVSGGW